MTKRRRTPFVLATAAFAVCAQATEPAPPRLHRVGVVCFSHDFYRIDAFREGLAKAGFVEGRNLVLDHVASPRQHDAVVNSVRALVTRQADVVTTWCGSVGAQAAREATTRTPVVFNGANDPVAFGLVASLSRPGGNLTGFSGQGNERAAKALQDLVSVKPGIRFVAVIHHDGDARLPWFPEYRTSLEAAARILRVEIEFVAVPTVTDLGSAMAQVGKRGDAAAYILAGITAPSDFHLRAAGLALELKLPSYDAMDPPRRSVALFGIASREAAHSREALMANVVARILRGTRPADIPVEQLQPPGLAINLRTARALGITIPPALLASATELIE